MLVEDQTRHGGVQIMLLSWHCVAAVPFQEYVDYRQARRVPVFNFAAARVRDHRTGEIRPMTGAEINRVRNSQPQQLRRIA